MPTYLPLRPLFWLVAAVLVLPGCRTYFDAQFLRPAEAEHPAHITRVQIVSSSSQPLSNYACDGLASSLNQSARYAVTDSVIAFRGKAAGRALALKNWNPIDSLCGINQANGLLWLRGIAIDSNTAVANVGHEVERYSAERRVAIRYRWLFLDPLNQQVVDEYRGARDTVIFAVDSISNRAVEGLPSSKAMAQKMLLESGLLYGNRIAPQWQPVGRYYYRTGSKLMRLGAKSADEGDWENAQMYWQADALSEGGREIRKGKAAFNLAVASEMLGHPAEAVRWAQISHYEYGQYDAGTYILLLRKRLLDSYYIRGQM